MTIGFSLALLLFDFQLTSFIFDLYTSLFNASTYPRHFWFLSTSFQSLCLITSTTLYHFHSPDSSYFHQLSITPSLIFSFDFSFVTTSVFSIVTALCLSPILNCLLSLLPSTCLHFCSLKKHPASPFEFTSTNPLE